MRYPFAKPVNNGLSSLESVGVAVSIFSKSAGYELMPLLLYSEVFNDSVWLAIFRMSNASSESPFGFSGLSSFPLQLI